jgi:hypothetical protein
VALVARKLLLICYAYGCATDARSHPVGRGVDYREIVGIKVRDIGLAAVPGDRHAEGFAAENRDRRAHRVGRPVDHRHIGGGKVRDIDLVRVGG